MKTSYKIRNFLLLVCSALCFSGCSNLIEDLRDKRIAVSSIEISSEESMIEGDTKTLTAAVLPENATDRTVTWTSSDSSVATVSDEGLVTAIKAGNATITAKAGNKTAECRVTVESAVIPVTSVTLDKTELVLNTGENETLTAAVLPENATDRTVTWTSDKPGIASVDSDGKVTAIKSGRTTITAKAGDKTATCSVTVNPEAAFAVSIVADNDISITNDSAAKTLTADAGYTSYKWFLDGTESGTDAVFDYSALTIKGTYNVTVEAVKDGYRYSATAYVRKE